MKKQELKKGDLVRLKSDKSVVKVITLNVLVKDDEGAYMVPYDSIESYHKEPVDTFKSSHREGVEL